jgi:hypothetical protein
MLERRIPRDEEGDTVSYSGPCLAELLAASGESRALLAADLDDAGVESCEFESCEFESVESTVVIAGSRPTSLPLAAAAERGWTHEASGCRPWPVATDCETGASSGTFGALAYTLAPRAVADSLAPRRDLARPGVAVLLASLGLLIGLCVGTVSSTDAPHPARALAAQLQVQPQPRERLAETTPLVSPTHQKSGTKRKGRVVGSTAPTVAHASAPTAAATAPPPAVEANSDAQQLEDRRLLLAAQAEHSF